MGELLEALPSLSPPQAMQLVNPDKQQAQHSQTAQHRDSQPICTHFPNSVPCRERFSGGLDCQLHVQGRGGGAGQRWGSGGRARPRHAAPADPQPEEDGKLSLVQEHWQGMIGAAAVGWWLILKHGIESYQGGFYIVTEQLVSHTRPRNREVSPLNSSQVSKGMLIALCVKLRVSAHQNAMMKIYIYNPSSCFPSSGPCGGRRGIPTGRDGGWPQGHGT